MNNPFKVPFFKKDLDFVGLSMYKKEFKQVFGE
jgi:hypothetical protein